MEPGGHEGSGFKQWVQALFKREKRSEIIPQAAEIKPKEIDPDDPEIRVRRIENQKTLETEIEKTFGLPFADRLKLVRNRLFDGVPSINGEDPREMRTVDLPRGEGLRRVNYASAELVRNSFLPALGQAVNELAEQVKQMDEKDRGDAAVKLASVIYTFGIPTHPYYDGNGQTFREMSLSYLHELAPKEFGNSYFPYKPVNSGDNLENNLQTPILSRLYGLNPGYMYSEEECKKEWALRCGRVRNETGQGAHEATEEEMRNMFPDEEAKDVIRHKFAQGQVLHDEWESELLAKHPSQSNIHYFIKYMLETEQGKTFIKNYVMHHDGPVIADPKNTSWYFRSAESMFSGIRVDIRNLLEPKEIHEGKFEEAKRIALR